MRVNVLKWWVWAAIAILSIPCAHAAKVRVTWTNPSTHTDGSPLTDLASVTVEWWACANASVPPPAAPGQQVVSTTVAGAAMYTWIFPTGSGPVCIAAFATDATNGAYQGGSVLSNVAFWTPPATLGNPGQVGKIALHPTQGRSS